MSGGIESNIWSNIEGNDPSFADSGDQFDSNTSVDTNPGNPGFDDADASLQQQVNQRKPRHPNEADEDNLTDPFAKKSSKSPDGRDQRKAQGKEDGKPKPRTNDRGDLVDEQGNVIATRGKERRIEMQNQRLRTTLETVQRRNEDLARQVADVQFLNNLPKQYNLDNDTVGEALQLAAIFNRNPADAVRQLTQKALAQGLDLHDIFDDQTLPNIGTKATKELLDQRLKPLEKEQRSQQDVEELTRVGQEAANNFLMDYPDAEVHQTDIANLMGEVIQDYTSRGRKIDPYLAAEKAWELLQNFATEHQLDITQPFKPQVDARARQQGNNPQQPNAGQPQTTPRPNQPEVRRSRPMPNGNGAASNPQTVQRRSNMAAPDDDTGSIVRSAMAEAGYNFNS